MRTVVELDPFRCRMWAFHERCEEFVAAESCVDEIRSFSHQGQLVPVVGRKLQGDPHHDVELVCGARRLFVARHLRKPLLVELRDLSDREALVLMEIENRQRKEVSPYERGLCFTRLLQEGLFKTQTELAEALGISVAQVSRLLRLARLPAVVIGAFTSPLEIREGWGLELSEACEGPQKRQAVIRRARMLQRRPGARSARAVFDELQAAAAGTAVGRGSRDTVITGEDGRPLFRIRHRRETVAFILFSERISTRQLAEIRHAIARYLQPRQSKGNGFMLEDVVIAGPAPPLVPRAREEPH